MPETTIILGGNQGNVPETFKKCEEKFELQGYNLVNISSLYSSKSWGYESENIFYNRVLLFKSNKTPQEIIADCLSIENELGRIRDGSGEYKDRIIDIDILFYGDEIIIEENLVIPHPRLHERMFCLAPLVEMMPEFIHPGLDKTIKTLFNECEDDNKVTRE